MISTGSSKSAANAAAAGSWCSWEESRLATITLVSRAVVSCPFLLFTLADLAENLFDRCLGEGWSLFRGHRDPERSALDDLDLARQRFDLDLPFLDRDPQRHPRKDSSLVADCLG